jgi:hypothetical protein
MVSVSLREGFVVHCTGSDLWLPVACAHSCDQQSQLGFTVTLCRSRSSTSVFFEFMSCAFADEGLKALCLAGSPIASATNSCKQVESSMQVAQAWTMCKLVKTAIRSVLVPEHIRLAPGTCVLQKPGISYSRTLVLHIFFLFSNDRWTE